MFDRIRHGVNRLMSVTPSSPTLSISQRDYRIAGNSVSAFAAVMALSCILGSIVYQVLVFDFGSVIVFFLGRSTAGGSRRAAGWSLGLTAFYLLAAIAVLLAMWLSPDRLRFAGGPVPAEMFPWAAPEIAVAAVWAAINIVLLIRARRALPG
jgi:hypothetical protein